MAMRYKPRWCHEGTEDDDNDGTHVHERYIANGEDAPLSTKPEHLFNLASMNCLAGSDCEEAGKSGSSWEKAVYATKSIQKWGSDHRLRLKSDPYHDVDPYPGALPDSFCVWHVGDDVERDDVMLLVDRSGSMEYEDPAFDSGENALQSALDEAVCA